VVKLILDRSTFALACAGLFVAGVLSLPHLVSVDLPCGVGERGCATITRHPSSFWFGIPVANFGFAAYLAIAVLVAWRFFAGEELSRKLLRGSLAISTAGALVSVGLQAYSFGVIKEHCIWCIASAAIMIAIVFVQAALSQAGGVAGTSRKIASDVAVIGLFTLAFATSLGLMTTKLMEVEYLDIDPRLLGPNPQELLAPESGHSVGPKDAKVTIVEFADVNCPLCRAMYKDMKRLVQEYSPNLRLVFHHFPLVESKPMSLPGAVLAEFAHTHGKFWEYMDRTMALEDVHPDSPEIFYGVIREIGLDVREASKIVDDVESAEFDRVYQDRRLADSLGLRVTPSFFVLAEGQPVKAFQGKHVRRVLGSEPYRSILKGHESSK
jgi:protein-disulfide isomerase